jgi:osmotically-inducible protein OsmY
MSDAELVDAVIRELYWDPKLDSSAIAVSAESGRVTLRGTVGTLHERRDARKSAERVFGVTSVDNRLEVRHLTKHRRADADIRGDVLQALMLSSRVPRSVDADVRHGVVTLTGTAQWQYQRDEAEHVASRIRGASGLVDEIVISNPVPTVEDLEDSIDAAFRRNAALEARDLSLVTSNGTVTVTGAVGSRAERDAAIAAAWAAPGVTDVKDELRVEYREPTR